ncbi:MAG: hypothetical protein ACREH8_06590 [Opitutaceae bacterium]
MTKSTFVVSLLLAIGLLPLCARAADGASVHAILIIASEEKAPADRRLAPYEATLQRNLPESSFRFVADGSVAISGHKSRASISLDGHRIELEGGSKDGDGILVKVRWRKGKNVVMNNAFTFQPGVPIVLGQRPGGNGDVPIVILVAK